MAGRHHELAVVMEPLTVVLVVGGIVTLAVTWVVGMREIARAVESAYRTGAEAGSRVGLGVVQVGAADVGGGGLVERLDVFEQNGVAAREDEPVGDDVIAAVVPWETDGPWAADDA